jgi:hypothetical protein
MNCRKILIRRNPCTSFFGLLHDNSKKSLPKFIYFNSKTLAFLVVFVFSPSCDVLIKVVGNFLNHCLRPVSADLAQPRHYFDSINCSGSVYIVVDTLVIRLIP